MPKTKLTKKTKKKRLPATKGISESNLLKLRREVVFKIFDDCCFFCGQHKFNVPLEDHHPIHRKSLLTRYDWRNAILVCKYVCHEYAESPTGKAKIAQYQIQNNFMDYLQERTMTTSKDWLAKQGITKEEFLKSMYDDLKKKLSEF